MTWAVTEAMMQGPTRGTPVQCQCRLAVVLVPVLVLVLRLLTASMVRMQPSTGTSQHARNRKEETRKRHPLRPNMPQRKTTVALVRGVAMKVLLLVVPCVVVVVVVGAGGSG